MLTKSTLDIMDRAEYLKEHIKKTKDSTEEINKKIGESSNHTDNENKKTLNENSLLENSLKDIILKESPNVEWSDIAGLENAKMCIEETVMMPIKYPKLFKDVKPWQGILLYGPPGTGKSYIAKAIATMTKSTFLSVSSADLISKWQGESEKLVKTLFGMARKMKPSIIFIDEIDSLCSARDEGGSESTTRVKTEFLTQMVNTIYNQEWRWKRSGWCFGFGCHEFATSPRHCNEEKIPKENIHTITRQNC